MSDTQRWNVPAAKVECGECMHWKGLGGGDGECHRNAPAPIVIVIPIELTLRTVWPPVSQFQSCGDFHPKAVQQVSDTRPSQQHLHQS